MTCSFSSECIVGLFEPRKVVSIVKSVNRYVENGVIIVECVLNASSVVDVPVENEDALDVTSASVLSVLRADGDIVEETEAATFFFLGVMTGRSDDRNSVRNL